MGISAFGFVLCVVAAVIPPFNTVSQVSAIFAAVNLSVMLMHLNVR